MIQSMTGYGRGVLARDGREVTLELKSVNHRYLDLSFRMPRTFGYMEDALRKRIQERLERGHVDIFITYKNTRDDAREVAVDRPLLSAYLRALRQIKSLADVPDDAALMALARLPDVMMLSAQSEDEEALSLLVLDALDMALAELTAMRVREGKALSEDVAARCAAASEAVDQIQARAPQIVAEMREKIQLRVKELLGGAQPDPERLENEVAYLADRYSIAEEITRLKAHIAQLSETLSAREGVGRKLDFLVQEMNREINTIGSKASDLTVTNLVVSVKSEVEKIREQVQNIQ
ncbi:MAG: YicC/YloC family endoribonuclease [Christensenellales bacterium]|jgi:uncharacterized protein (TIGR00255 family)